MPFPSLRAAGALAVTALAFAGAAATTGAAERPSGDHTDRGHAVQRLVLRGQDTVSETGPCPDGVCTLALTNGSFQGTPVGTGAYGGTLELAVRDAFDNGEDGLCAPIRGTITLGTGTPDRLVLALAGDSCQDGSGPLDAASFTGLARFHVKRGTGKYAGTTGHGLATFAEDASDREQMTLIGTIRR